MGFLSAFPLLDPSGTIALAERGLMINATFFMLIVAVPVFFLLFFFAWHYRAGNKKAKYMPNWEHAKIDELIWWAIPFEIVLILGALTWSSTHNLDPMKPFDSAQGKPLVVQVVALNYKWLFIYPEQNVASVNYLAMPINRPVKFRVTAEAPMNSFWIPALGGQIYAMTGMTTTLHLMATEAGSYRGASANYSGTGFADMKFIAEVMPQENFDSWVMRTKVSSRVLMWDEYKKLAEESVEKEPIYYSRVTSNLFDMIVGQFTMHSGVGELPVEAFPLIPQAGTSSSSMYEGAH